MTTTQLRDNILYIAALQKFTAMVNSKNMTPLEFTLVKKELERRLRPSVYALN